MKSFFQCSGFIAIFFIVAVNSACAQTSFQGDWHAQTQRLWAGPEYWTNPMMHWRVDSGRLECFMGGGDRNVHLLTHELSDRSAPFEMSVKLGRLQPDGEAFGPGWAGFKVGCRGRFNDYRDAALYGQGLNCGVNHAGRLFIESFTQDNPTVGDALQAGGALTLKLSGQPAANPKEYTLTLRAIDQAGKTRGELTQTVSAKRVVGQAALCAYGGESRDNKNSAQFFPMRQNGPTNHWLMWFDQWRLAGDKVDHRPDRALGPILWTMYTQSRGVLKLSVQLTPLGDQVKDVELQIKENSAWRTIASAPVDALAANAIFRIENWDAGRTTPFRVRYPLLDASGKTTMHDYEGLIRAQPSVDQKLVLGVLNCVGPLGFPHTDIVQRMGEHNPDLMFFAGDQIYEPEAGYGAAQNQPAPYICYDYLRKWYVWGWAFRDLMRDRPVVVIPDDHDVFQGNVWAAGGRAAPRQGGRADRQCLGGYCEVPEFINTVHRTQTGHLPDPYDPTPVEQNISVYYTHLNVGGVSFAILGDRQFKSGPQSVLPADAKVWNGFIQNPDWDPLDSDVADAVLLGERQMHFLDDWTGDWSQGARLKCVLSQTTFNTIQTTPADVHTDAQNPRLYIPKPGEYLENDVMVADMDSNGWPHTQRNRAVETIRKGFAFHIAGDQHLGSFAEYGVHAHRDAGYAFCAPAVSNIWPRRWFPKHPGANRDPNEPAYTGDYVDPFGNLVTVYAVSNPVQTGKQPATLHDRATGFGVVRFDPAKQTITTEAWTRYGEQYPGWPRTVTMDQQHVDQPIGRLTVPLDPPMQNPVVQVIDQATQEVVYTRRIICREVSRVAPAVFAPGRYTVRVGDPDTDQWRTYPDLTVE